MGTSHTIAVSSAITSVVKLRVAIALVTLVMVVINLIYAASAYPFGKLSERMSHKTLLALGLVVPIVADLMLATDDHWPVRVESDVSKNLEPDIHAGSTDTIS
jgi:MFS family permease